MLLIINISHFIPVEVSVVGNLAIIFAVLGEVNDEGCVVVGVNLINDVGRPL